MNKNFKKYLLISLAIIALVGILGFSKFCLPPHLCIGGGGLGETKTNQSSSQTVFNELSSLPTIQGNSIIAISSMPEIKITRKIKVVTTAYSSTTWQTDSTPFITAAGTYVRDGIVANNLLPFGTKVRLPEIYGDKIFVVEDRMHWKKGYYHIDIWFASYSEAKNFGIKRTYLEILEN